MGLKSIHSVLFKAGKTIDRVIKPFVHAHLIIGLAIFCLCLESFLFFSIEPNYTYAAMAGCGGIAFYGIHRFFQINKYGNIRSVRIEELKQFRWINIFSIVLFSLLFSTLFIYNKFYHEELLVLIFSLSVLYLLPLFPGNKRLRDLPFIKLYLIAFFWTLITALIPFLLGDISNNSCKTLYMFERFVFILFITLPFDIRDYYDDKEIGLHTMVTQLGIKRIKRMGIIAASIGVMMILLLWVFSCFSLSFALSIFWVYILSIALFIKSDPNISTNFYSLIIDGLMILRYGMVIILLN